MIDLSSTPMLAAAQLASATLGPVLAFAVPVALGGLGLAIALASWRLLRGPSLPDRVVALDLIGTIAVGAIAVYAILEDEPIYLIVSVVVALLMFIGTVAFAYYMQKGGGQK
ncbi:MAG: cation:proton antiporter [Phycisphaeraceae bacterium]|nr:cation:proton antiporter [Phycisphaeraceae bacterium]MCW5753226.1 cation:proton antiporter [Phycisphaeraceae bacterium]